MVGELDHTFVSPEQHSALTVTLAAEGAPSSMVGTTTSVVRTTVLPRVEVTAGAPAIVLDTRERYVTDKLLGEGGVGEVVRAMDNDIARPVAIKRIRSEVKSPSTLLRFVEEIRTIGQLEHANIVPIHDVGVDERGDYFFVMKYMQGETLEEIIARLAAGDRATHEKYGVEERMRVFLGVLEAISHAHSRGFVHRDIKPANVMVGEHGQVMVMDWGLAKRVGAAELPATLATRALGQDTTRLHQTAAGALLGTPAYMSPEQARGEEATERSDIYSLCVMLYELLTLKHPLEDCHTLETMLDAVQHREFPIAGLVSHAHQRSTPMDLTWYLKAGLSKDPAERYQSVDAMIERLQLRAQGIVPIQCHITFAKRIGGIAMKTIDRYPIQVSVAMMLTFLGTVSAAVVAAIT